MNSYNNCNRFTKCVDFCFSNVKSILNKTANYPNEEVIEPSIQFELKLSSKFELQIDFYIWNYVIFFDGVVCLKHDKYYLHSLREFDRFFQFYAYLS